ncbi:MAG TPA: glutamine-hydrolyzing GMP synthase [Candidatus Marinimicrobia bacterium]|nr:glutamine-hydrolyzing GMP synthase [Candidatus Neomarinimicrobiota bacterium]
MSNISKVWIVDFGSQYTQLIARRVRDMSVYSEIVPSSVTALEAADQQVSALILSGGPASVNAVEAPQISPDFFEMDIPILGICYGLQLIARHFGARVHSDIHREYGSSWIDIKKQHALFEGISTPTQVWMSHGDHVDSIPNDFEIIATSNNSVPAALAHTTRRIMGLQFHPEVEHTTEGKKILANFLFNIAGLRPDWTPEKFIEQTIADIRERTGTEQVLMAMSGGVDSSTMGVLINRAIGRRCIPVFINHGLLRQTEQIQVVRQLKNQMGLPIRSYNYSHQFLSALKGVTDPERKRKIIGREFIRAFEEIAQQFPNVKFLAQGTLYPDVIESRSVNGPSQVIKSHHNVGGLPKRMNFQLIEPFSCLFKDEVRKIGRELGIPPEILGRHPFPGPGLAVRILGEVTPRRLSILRRADAIYIEELRSSGYYDKVWQAFAILIPVKTVGVMGDKRTYENALALRAVTSSDGMTADWARLPDTLLSRIANRIVNEVRGINRVVYDVTSKPPATIEWE